jgi:hypothetical protein
MPEYNGVRFDSEEELHFVYWLEDMNIPYEYHPEPLILSEPVYTYESKQLKTKTKVVRKTLLRACTYGADFKVRLDDIDMNTYRVSGWWPDADVNYIYIDIKGKFGANSQDGAKFSIVQKWTYQRHGIYVNKVIPEDLFNITFCPDRCRYTKTGKPKKAYSKCKTLKEYKERNEK